MYKLKSNFTDFQQQLFVSSFYCYLNYDKPKDFVIDFNNVWSWLGFSNKENAKRALERYFKENIGYKILLVRSEEQDFTNENKQKNTEKKHGGHNKETILLTIKKCFIHKFTHNL